MADIPKALEYLESTEHYCQLARGELGRPTGVDVGAAIVQATDARGQLDEALKALAEGDDLATRAQRAWAELGGLGPVPKLRTVCAGPDGTRSLEMLAAGHWDALHEARELAEARRFDLFVGFLGDALASGADATEAHLQAEAAIAMLSHWPDYRSWASGRRAQSKGAGA